VQEACGEWVAFLDSDDEWTPDRNRELLTAAERVPPEVAWIFGDLRVVSDEGDATTLYERYGLRIKESPQVFADALSVQYPFQFGLLQGSFIRRSVLLEFDCFNEGLQSSEDFLVGFQVACRYKFAAISSVVGKYFQTSDLFATSATVEGTFGPDYHRARMLAFALVVESGRKRPWNMLYATHVRELCQALAARAAISRKLALQQFRYGSISAKGMAFLAAATFGRRGIRAWRAIAGVRRRHMRTVHTECSSKTGFEAAIENKIPVL
jgi:glycosyltransferase involved in cell wall biosynthesis